MRENITFTEHADGSVTADGFPERILVALELLEHHRPELMQYDETSGELRFMVANGTALYRRAGYRDGHAVAFELAHGNLSEAGAG